MTDVLITHRTLVSGLRELGIEAGDAVLVHTRLSAFGFVVGAQRTLVEGLLEAVGPSGTVMMPAYSGELSDPAEWCHPPVPHNWIEPIRSETQAYDRRLTPSRKMGSVAEYFRNFPGTLRSEHPQSSFCANGRRATDLLEPHHLSFRFGPESPLGRLASFGGKSILLGAPSNTNSLLYLALYYQDGMSRITKSAPMLVDGRKCWKEYSDIRINNSWFDAFTKEMVSSGQVRSAMIGYACCRMFCAKEITSEACLWLSRNSLSA
jgi:aminoglycoside 3-N-acetyltransferase